MEPDERAKKVALREAASAVVEACSNIDANKVPAELVSALSAAWDLAQAVIDAAEDGAAREISAIKSAIGEEAWRENPNLKGIKKTVFDRLHKK